MHSHSTMQFPRRIGLNTVADGGAATGSTLARIQLDVCLNAGA